MNIELTKKPRFPGFLVKILWISLIACVILLLEAILRQSIDRLLTRLVMTFIGFVAGAFLAGIQVSISKRRSFLLTIGILAILASQVSFFMLVWTNWMVHTIVWRIWWITMVPSVFTTHLILIASYSKEKPGIIEKLTSLSVIWAGIMILSLGFRRDVFAELNTIFLSIALIPATGTVIGSSYLLFHWMLNRVGSEKISKRAMVAGMFMTHFIVLLAGFYIGRTIPRETDTHLDNLIKQTVQNTNDALSSDIYDGQSVIATFLGDTKLTDREPFISMEQIAELKTKLKPGDILLERRNWFLSNPFLPGFWPHAALYIGTIDDLKPLGGTENPAIQKHLEAYLKKSADGHTYTIIEALSEGVVLNTLEHSMHADYVAVLRPKATKEEIGLAITRAFENLGKPYDFNFDFDDRTKLVCTQVVWLSYEGIIDFKTKRVMGRNTMPAVEIARKYVTEKDTPAKELDFILFLDAKPDATGAYFAGEEEFCKTINRPRELLER
ncbi:MAG: hypothetical protein HY811_03540 [Planctomycetes bacterium]|nr:hypothetical protein [Planctomycetota bacterium]